MKFSFTVTDGYENTNTVQPKFETGNIYRKLWISFNHCTLFLIRQAPDVERLIPYSRVLLEKLTDPKLVKKFPVFYGHRKFNTAFTRSQPLVPIHSQRNPTDNIPLCILFNTHLMLSSHLCPDPHVYPPTLHALPFSPMRATCPIHLTLLDLITLIIHLKK